MKTFTSPLAGEVSGPQGATIVTRAGGAALQPNTVTGDKMAGGQVVKSLNALRNDVTLGAGANAQSPYKLPGFCYQPNGSGAIRICRRTVCRACAGRVLSLASSV